LEGTPFYAWPTPSLWFADRLLPRGTRKHLRSNVSAADGSKLATNCWGGGQGRCREESRHVESSSRKLKKGGPKAAEERAPKPNAPNSEKKTSSIKRLQGKGGESRCSEEWN